MVYRAFGRKTDFVRVTENSQNILEVAWACWGGTDTDDTRKFIEIMNKAVELCEEYNDELLNDENIKIIIY